MLNELLNLVCSFIIYKFALCKDIKTIRIMKLSQLLKCYLLALLLNALPLSATAYDFMVDGLAYNITSDTSVSVAYAQEYSSSGLTTINIPDSVTYNGKTYLVVAIDRSAFSGCSSLVSVTIPNSVTSIGKDAFNNTAI